MSKSFWTRENFPIAPSIRNPGGSLSFKTGAWRMLKPIIDGEKCSKCGLCQVYCPDDAVEKTRQGCFEIDYDYCKGCGICANECPVNAIKMVVE